MMIIKYTNISAGDIPYQHTSQYIETGVPVIASTSFARRRAPAIILCDS